MAWNNELEEATWRMHTLAAWRLHSPPAGFMRLQFTTAAFSASSPPWFDKILREEKPKGNPSGTLPPLLNLIPWDFRSRLVGESSQSHWIVSLQSLADGYRVHWTAVQTWFPNTQANAGSTEGQGRTPLPIQILETVRRGSHCLV